MTAYGIGCFRKKYWRTRASEYLVDQNLLGTTLTSWMTLKTALSGNSVHFYWGLLFQCAMPYVDPCAVPKLQPFHKSSIGDTQVEKLESADWSGCMSGYVCSSVETAWHLTICNFFAAVTFWVQAIQKDQKQELLRSLQQSDRAIAATTTTSSSNRKFNEAEFFERMEQFEDSRAKASIALKIHQEQEQLKEVLYCHVLSSLNFF